MADTTPESPVAERADVERLVGRKVGDLALYEQALRHRSVLRERPDRAAASNERLEFLGDAVLGFVIAEHLYQKFPDRDEGYLTRLRAKLVNGPILADYARRLGLGPRLLLSDNMAKGGGHDNDTILADAFEALIGALYLDHGLDAARTFVVENVLEEIDLRHLANRQQNFKSALLEYAQARSWPQPVYRVVEEEGPSHDKRFTVAVHVHEKPLGTGTAGSKKKAEQQAAARALAGLHAQEGEIDDG